MTKTVGLLTASSIIPGIMGCPNNDTILQQLSIRFSGIKRPEPIFLSQNYSCVDIREESFLGLITPSTPNIC
jgi:hypothetical protein